MQAGRSEEYPVYDDAIVLALQRSGILCRGQECAALRRLQHGLFMYYVHSLGGNDADEDQQERSVSAPGEAAPLLRTLVVPSVTKCLVASSKISLPTGRLG